MEQQHSRIVEDLRGLLTGAVASGEVIRRLYATDASLYEVVPTAVVFPQSTADVSACLRYCREHEIHVHPRGGGTGLAGESLGDGVVLDFSRSMRRVLSNPGGGADHIRVQPGLAYERVNDFLKERGRHIGPQPQNPRAGTIGGMLGVNAAGSRGVKYGGIRQYVAALQVVLADGTICEIGDAAASSGTNRAAAAGSAASSESASEATGPDEPADGAATIRRELTGLFDANKELMARVPPIWRQHDVGYPLHGILDTAEKNDSGSTANPMAAGQVDLRKMIVGSEGTLAVVTEAVLATSPLPQHRAVALLFFETLDKAARAALELAPLGPSACDLLDRRQLMLAREWDSFYELVIPPSAEAMLFIEHEADDLVEVRDRLQQGVDRVRRRKKMAFDSRQAFDEEEFQLFWRLATPVSPLLYRLGGRSRPVPFAEDVAVPPEALSQMIVAAQNILKQRQLTAAVFAHAAVGRLQVRPIIDPAREGELARLPAFAEDLYQAALDLGGAITGGAALGIGRTPFLERRVDASVLDLFRHIKLTFDPSHILNPGKILGADNPMDHVRSSSGAESLPDSMSRMTKSESAAAAAAAAASHESSRDIPAPQPAEPETPDLPEEPAPSSLEAVSLQLAWSPAQALDAAWECNGCGDCRAQSDDARMCPLFRAAPAEIASPRAKANAMRALLSEDLPSDAVTSEEFKQLVDLCVNCHMCRLECPAGVDIPRLMTEARGQYVSAKGLRFADWIVSRLDILGRMGGRNPKVSNWILRSPKMRWLMEKTVGFAQGRKLPTYSRRTFLRSAHRRRLTRPTKRSQRKVAYFFDHYVNYHDPELGNAVVAILERHGIAVYVPPRQLLSGMSMISVGNLDRARKVARRNLATLAECVRQGYDIIATEPAAVLCLTREYVNLLDSPDAHLVAENTSEVCDYLWKLHKAGELRLDFRPLSGALAYHTPCHINALEIGTPGLELLRLVPGLTVRRIEAGCSGMAGTFGLKRHNYRSSLRAGWGLISRIRDSEFQFGATECSACKMQMEQGTTKPTIHPLKLLARSYNVMPAELHDLLRRQSGDLTVT